MHQLAEEIRRRTQDKLRQYEAAIVELTIHLHMSIERATKCLRLQVDQLDTPSSDPYLLDKITWEEMANNSRIKRGLNLVMERRHLIQQTYAQFAQALADPKGNFLSQAIDLANLIGDDEMAKWLQVWESTNQVVEVPKGDDPITPGDSISSLLGPRSQDELDELFNC